MSSFSTSMRRRAWLVAFLAAFLVFCVQPMVARRFLPLLGGSSQVWNGCMLFFQVALLGGYAWAHWGNRWLGARRHGWVHLLLLLVAMVWLPVEARQTVAPEGGDSPSLWLLLRLTRLLGLPFLLLAATSPLIQRWYADRDEGGNPYSLYAASNWGSVLALLCYPFLLEPLWDQSQQESFWYQGLCVFGLILGWTFWGRAGEKREEEEKMEARGALASGAPASGSLLRLLPYSAVPVSLMLGVTSHLSQELPPVPLLWILPLLLYLLSHVLVFSEHGLLSPRRWAMVQAFFASLVAIVLFVPMRLGGQAVHLLAFFASAMVCHGELVRRKPAPRHLTSFYLTMAAGGALGGFFNAIVAPLVFPVVIEYPLALILACWLRPSLGDESEGLPGTGRREGPEATELAAVPGSKEWARALIRQHREEEAGRRAGKGPAWATLLSPPWLAPLGLALASSSILFLLPRRGDARDVASRVGVLLVASAIAFWLRRRRGAFVGALSVVMATGFFAFRWEGALLLRRSYYGLHRVLRAEDPPRHLLFHGSTLHGAEDWSEAGRGRPLAYFHPESAVASVFASSRGRGAGTRFAVVGLGMGSLAWYVKAGQFMQFFEIDPTVLEIARRKDCFTILAQREERVDVKVGDGRLLLSREEDESYDCIVLDAFASDAAPVHLLSTEAMTLYFEKLRPGGVLLFNVSNRHLRLAALVQAAARACGKASTFHLPPPDPTHEVRGYHRGAWAMVARRTEDLKSWRSGSFEWMANPPGPSLRPWTDRRSSLYLALR